ncbi:ABC transporter integral membrane subunit [Haloferax gibbonsii ATCC 33959]|uniref:ABC transporter integral membrane subunit n=1 Tax=Haloferax gibbonsii (strain ATCC 33959 / DSM 4427 / JCM 8863 / NBRC 102184 / NCIMB 2188 / Ma 2.38) TaxID=1227459 RepID=M0GVR6_HALGM|nr:carbohydrate ABC transporter permease [Haloferax gibbonsii]ELZ76315.1 ABC transporter integral membrane subunit [Haloferax gibbonsii ATCC 33959]
MFHRINTTLEQLSETALRSPADANRLVFTGGTIVFVLTTLFPFYWLFVLALTPNELISNMGLVPKGYNLAVFAQVFQELPLHRYIFNSVLISLMVTAVVISLGSVAGYAFGRYEFSGKRPLMLIILVISYFPPAAFLLPLFRLLTGSMTILGIQTPDFYNTPLGVAFPLSALTLPFAIFVLTTFYSQIPDGLEDAARIEGTTRLGALYRVIMPLSLPGLTTVGVLTFITVYNEFFFSFLMTDGSADHWSPLVWGISSIIFEQQFTTPYNLLAAASIIGVFPIAVLVLFAQEKIVSGLTAGALKE